MVTKKRTFSVAAAAAAGVVLLAACSAGAGNAGNSGSESGESAGGSLTLMSQWGPSDPEGKVLESFISDFEDKTGIAVELTVVAGEGSDLATTFESMVLAGNEPDLVLKNLFNTTVNWMDQGATVPVDEYLADWELADVFQASALDVWKSPESGKLRGFPRAGLSWPVWYNMELLQKAGVSDVPTTTDELIAATTKLRDAGIQPFTAGGSDWSGTKLFFQVVQNNLDANEAKELMLNGGYCASPNAMKGIELFGQLVDSGVFVDDVQGITHDQQVAAFMDGEAAIMSDGQWSFSVAPDELADSTFLGGFPIGADSVHTAPTAYDSPNGPGLHVTENGEKNIEAVKAFVKAFYEPQWTEAFAVDAAMVPVVDPSTLDLSSASPLFQQSQQETPSRVEFLPMPDDHVPGGVLDQIPSAVALAYTPGTSASAVCSAIDDIYSSQG